MKHLKKFATILTCLILLLYTFVSASRAEPIIDPELPGAIYIHKYAVENLENHETPATGEPQDVNGLPPIPNISFTITRVNDDAENAATAIPNEGDNGYTQTLATNTSGLAAFTGLAQGTYLIHEENSPAVQAPVADFLVTVPMTNPTGDAWIYEIHVYPKNELMGAPTVDIFISDFGNKYDSFPLQSQVTWLATAQIPGDIQNAGAYQLTVHLDDYLSYTPENLILYYIDAETNRLELDPETDFTLADTENSLAVTLTKTGQYTLANASETNGTSTLYLELPTLFQIPGDDLPAALATNISANITLAYTNELGFPSISTPDQAASIYTGGIHLFKIDGRNTDIPLAGAVFKVYPTLADATNGTNAIPAPGGTSDWTVPTNNEGIAAFYGLSYGGRSTPPAAGSTTYYFVETQAPAGYNLLREPAAITIDSTSHLTENHFTIQNRTGFTLPMTGGMGTIIIYAAGSIIMLLALLLFFNRNRKKNEK